MPTNFYLYFLVAFIPLIIGAVYYGVLFKEAWMKVNHFNKESLKGANMGWILGMTYLLSILITFFLTSVVIHQLHVSSLVFPDVFEPGNEAPQVLSDFMNKYGDRHRSFFHGMIHGGTVAIFFIMPVITINGLFERRGFKYSLIHFGYWFISLVLMGGMICEYLGLAPAEQTLF